MKLSIELETQEKFKRGTLMVTISEGLIMLGFILIILGIAVMFIGFLHMAFSSTEKKESKVEAGGVIMIGPIPIAFGTSSKALLYAMILATVVMLLSIFLIVYTQKLVPR